MNCAQLNKIRSLKNIELILNTVTYSYQIKNGKRLLFLKLFVQL